MRRLLPFVFVAVLCFSLAGCAEYRGLKKAFYGTPATKHNCACTNGSGKVLWCGDTNSAEKCESICNGNTTIYRTSACTRSGASSLF